MAINLAAKYASKIAEKYTAESYFKGKLNNEYEFNGVKSVKIYTPVTVGLNDYTRNGTNRYGTPVEMEDTLQEMILTQDRSFALTVDKGNNEDQMGIKPAAKMLALELKEQAIPEYDRYVAKKIALNGGITFGSGTAISKSNIVDRITDGTVALDNAEVPSEGRTLYITAAGYKALRLSDEFTKADALITKGLEKGTVGTFDGMPVIKVPASRWLRGVNFMIVHKTSVTAPVKLSESKLHQDPPGINGNLMEGRQYYDCFVIGARANGIYVDFDSAVLTKVATPTHSSSAFACATGGAVVKFTVDGSDPRYSATAIVGTSTSGYSGVLAKACATKDGCIVSDVFEKQL